MQLIASKRGFTLVEVIIAMAIFSLALMALTAGVINLYHIYQSGNEIRNTQQASRNMTELISRDARSAQNIVTGVDSHNNAYFCLLAPNAQGDTGIFGTSVYSGKKYYIAADDNFGTNHIGALHRADIQVTFPSNPSSEPTTDACNGTAPAVATTSGDEILSPPSVSVIQFGAAVPDPRMLQFNLTVAASNALAATVIDYTQNPPRCNGSDRYCSITTVNSSAAAQKRQSELVP